MAGVRSNVERALVAAAWAHAQGYRDPYGCDLYTLCEHYEDLIAAYHRVRGRQVRPPMVPDWYWRLVVLGDDGGPSLTIDLTRVRVTL